MSSVPPRFDLDRTPPPRVWGGQCGAVIICAILWALTGFGWSVEISPDEMQLIMNEVQLRNTWFMYSSEDGKNHTFNINKEGKLVAMEPSFSAKTRFGLGSNTKTLTALLALQAVESGQLKLESTLDQVAQQVEESDRKRGRQGPPIEIHPDFRLVTLKNLLTHHAGFPGVDTLDFKYPEHFSRDALMRRIFKMGPGPAVYRQDSADAPFCFHYSNEGYAVLAEILERLSEPHESYEGLLQKRLFAPLGMLSGHLITKEEAFRHIGKKGSRQPLPVELGSTIAPSAAAVCTLNDWMTLMRHIMNGINGSPSSSAVFRDPKMFQLLTTPQENCFYGTGALMVSRDPQAAYHFGSNSIHSSLAWVELNPSDKARGISCIVVSTEPFHDVSSQFYFLAQSIQKKLTLLRDEEKRATRE